MRAVALFFRQCVWFLFFVCSLLLLASVLSLHAFSGRPKTVVDEELLDEGAYEVRTDGGKESKQDETEDQEVSAEDIFSLSRERAAHEPDYYDEPLDAHAQL